MKRDGSDEILEQVNNVCISNSFEVPLRHTSLLLTISECVYVTNLIICTLFR